MNKMKYISVMVILFVVLQMQGQQTPQTTFFNKGRAFWNPAYTGFDPAISADVFVRQQWLGFGSSAPRTIMADYQHNFIDYNMAASGSLQFDQTGPVSKRGVNLNYAYQVKDIGRNDAQFCAGVTAGLQQYVFDGSDEVVVSGGDPLLANSNQTAFFPSVGAGIFYQSGTRAWKNDTYLYGGLSFQQAYQTNVLLGQLNQQRVSHLIFDLGSKIYNYDLMIEPSVSVNFTEPDIMSVLLGVSMEMRDAFWAGAGYNSVGAFAIQGGYILNEISGRDTRLRLGVLGSFGTGDSWQNLGPSAELLIRYEFDLD